MRGRVVAVLLLAGCKQLLGFDSVTTQRDAAIDADIDPQVDAPDGGFDFGRCPAAYEVVQDAPSRYLFIVDGNPFSQQISACSDGSTATHLATIDSIAERDALRAAAQGLGGVAGGKLYVGGVQPQLEASPVAGWVNFDGSALLITLWRNGEPNDGNGNEDDQEDAAALDIGGNVFEDVSFANGFGAVCECDGKPVPASVKALLP